MTSLCRILSILALLAASCSAEGVAPQSDAAPAAVGADVTVPIRGVADAGAADDVATVAPDLAPAGSGPEVQAPDVARDVMPAADVIPDARDGQPLIMMPTFTLDLTDVLFGTVTVGSSIQAGPFIVTAGGSPLTGLTVATSIPELTIDPGSTCIDPTWTVPASGRCSIIVNFRALTSGKKSGTITLSQGGYVAYFSAYATVP